MPVVVVVVEQPPDVEASGMYYSGARKLARSD